MPIEPKEWNLRSRSRDGLKISDYPDLTFQQARQQIAQQLKNRVPCISGENVDDNLIGRVAGDYTKTAARGAVDGVTWAYVHVDGTENTYQVKKNEKLCLDMTTGKYLTGVNPAWGPGESVVVALALDDFTGPGVERIPVKLVVPPTDAPLGETLQVLLQYAAPPYRDRQSGGMNFWRYYAVPAFVFGGVQESPYTYAVTETLTAVWVINCTRYPVRGACMVSKHPSIPGLYVVVDSTQYPCFFGEWLNDWTNPDAKVPQSEIRLVRGDIFLTPAGPSHLCIGSNAVDFVTTTPHSLAGAGIGADVFIRQPGEYEITYGAEVTFTGKAYTGGNTSRALKVLGTTPPTFTNELMTVTGTSSQNDAGDPDDFAAHNHGMDHYHTVSLPSMVAAKICLIPYLFIPGQFPLATLQDFVADAFYINMHAALGNLQPGAAFSGEKTTKILWQPEHYGGAPTLLSWMRICVGVKHDWLYPYLNPDNGLSMSTSHPDFPKVLPLRAWVKIRPAGYDRAHDTDTMAFGTNEFPFEFPATSPGSYRWWGDNPADGPPPPVNFFGQ